MCMPTAYLLFEYLLELEYLIEQQVEFLAIPA